MSGCYVDAHGCTVCPAVPGAPAVPPQEVSDANLGWNAGANSVAMLDGDLHFVFTMPESVVGVIMGLRSARAGVGIPDLVEFGFLFFTTAGVDNYAVIERGNSAVFAVQTRAPGLGEQFEIVRRGERVTYLVNGVPLYTSTRHSSGRLVATNCSYASGDSAG